jgi:hypothetical protein
MKDIAKSPDKVMGAAPHFLSIPFPVFGPLVFALVIGNSPYAKYHGFRAVLNDLKIIVITVVIGLISLSMTIVSIIRLIQEGGQPDWVGMIIKGVIVWLLLAGYGLWNTISSIIDGVGVLTKPEHQPKSKIDRLAAKWAKYRSADSIELP